MQIADSTVEKILTQSGTTTADQIAELKTAAEKSSHSLQKTALDLGIIKNLDLIKLYAKHIDIPYTPINSKDITSDVLNQIPERIAVQYKVVLFKVDEDGTKYLAMDDPEDVQALDFLKKELGDNIKIFISSENEIDDALQLYRGDVSEQLTDVINVQREQDGSEQKVDESDISEDSPIAQTVNLLLEYAIRSSASDIHIEPREDFVQIRYRIDGVLKEVNRLPRNVLGALISRVKILSNLKIDERRVPQDGRFKIKVMGKQYALRVSTLPIADGEKVVIRILDESNQSIGLNQLGYWGKSLLTIHDAMSQPNGMILVTGPTGSGKSTSLFSILSQLNTPDVNISTIEDPVEYKISGVNQTQTNPKAGMTFASGLRALLRQDPNIIMVGEIRDSETANLGIQAALTGHLVFTTLHTNNAATCLPRLLDMDIEPFLIASTVKAVVGQRLVRRLCVNCRQSYSPDQSDVTALQQSFNLSPEKMHEIHTLEVQAKEGGIGADDAISSTDSTISSLWRAGDDGCDECNHSGFRGRIGIYEVLDNTIDIQKLIMTNATSNDIQDQAILDGMITMQSDGLIKALRGLTTIEEVLRVTREQ